MKYLVGTRPSGRLHLGHLFSVINPALKYNADVLVAEYHSPQDDADAFAEILGKFIPSRQIIRQSNNFDASLFFKLLEHTPSGLLNHMPQYKVKEKNALMFTYPVLMAHDVVGYDVVIVGDDQRPHAEFAADILPRLGKKSPIFKYDGGKVMDLKHPENKMSKSVPSSCLFLDDDKETIYSKIKSANTNEQGRANLEAIYIELYGNEFVPPELNTDLKDAIYVQLTELLIRN